MARPIGIKRPFAGAAFPALNNPINAIQKAIFGKVYKIQLRLNRIEFFAVDLFNIASNCRFRKKRDGENAICGNTARLINSSKKFSPTFLWKKARHPLVCETAGKTVFQNIYFCLGGLSLKFLTDCWPIFRGVLPFQDAII